MKKRFNMVFLIVFIILVSAIPFFLLIQNEGKPKFTNEEMEFIKKNKDTIFLTGYYPGEREFSKKLCERIEEDVSLKLRI